MVVDKDVFLLDTMPMLPSTALLFDLCALGPPHNFCVLRNYPAVNVDHATARSNYVL